MNAEAIFRSSRWIWPENHNWDIANSYALFRREFDLERRPARAPLFITADQSYRLFVNGRFVARGPARGYQARWPYDELDVASYLRKGRNLLAIRCYHPDRSTFQYLTQGQAGLLVSFRSGPVTVVSDASWKSMRQRSASRDTVQSSMQLFGQEHVDLRLEEGDWTQLDFDDSAWIAPVHCVWNAAPWFSLEPRGIPMLVEKPVEPAALIGEGGGTSAEGYRDVRDVVSLRYREDRSHHPAQAAFKPLVIRATGMGKFRSYLFDFGRTVVGSLTFEISGAAGGEIIDTHLAETIEAATLTPDLVFPNHCRPLFGDRLVCRAGDFRIEFYHHYGFRYLAITVRDSSRKLRLTPRLNWIGYPLGGPGSFASSDETLARIWKTCAWTQQCCSLDAYVDTPWREQAQWWGDARVQAWNTFHLSGDARLFRRGIGQIAGQTTPDGVTYGHAPTMAHKCILPDFTLIWFLTLWDYFWQTGSTEPLLAHHDVVQKALGYFRTRTDSRSGLITYDDRFWLFLDWTDIFKDGAPTVYNLWLLLALDKLALLYRHAHRPAEASKLKRWAAQLRSSLGKLIGRDGLIADGIDRRGRIVRTTSIHSQTLALFGNLKGLDRQGALKSSLLPFVRGESQPQASPSAYWVTYVLTALQENGHGQDVVAFIRRWWTPMAAHGTTWENFAPVRGVESFSHAWSAHPLYHLMQVIGGVTQLTPAWTRIRFRPHFIGDHNETIVPSPRGQIVSRWRKTAQGIKVSLRLPTGVQAQIELPGVASRGWSKGGRWLVSAGTGGR